MKRWAARARRVLLATAVAVPCSAGVAADPPYRLDIPDLFGGPTASVTLMGTTYAYTPDAAAPRRLTITTMPAIEIRQKLGALTEVQCANLFVGELRASHDDFFAAIMTRPLQVGAREFTQFRWTGEKAGTTLTGVLSCGIIGDTYYVIDFVDALLKATGSFPRIRSSLKTLTPNTP